MPTVNEAEEPPVDLDEEGGGPVKSFLEHLEDLRWTLLKCGSAILVGGVICLVAGNRLVEILKRPLEQSDFSKPAAVETIGFYFGTNHLGTFHFPTNQIAAWGLESGKPLVADLQPLTVGTNQVLSLQIRPDTEERVVRRPGAANLINLGPVEGFYIAIQLAIYGGIALAFPFVLYYVLQFILPALKRNEKRYMLRGIIIGTGLFAAGVLFCYFVVMPIALNAAAKYSVWLGFEASQWRARDYISFVSRFMFGMGISFELPVVILTLVGIGVVSYETLARIRPYMVIILMAVGAMLTPPDVITQFMMAVPLYCLYELSVLIAWHWDRQEKRRLAAEGLL